MEIDFTRFSLDNNSNRLGTVLVSAEHKDPLTVSSQPDLAVSQLLPGLVSRWELFTFLPGETDTKLYRKPLSGESRDNSRTVMTDTAHWSSAGSSSARTHLPLTSSGDHKTRQVQPQSAPGESPALTGPPAGDHPVRYSQ